MTNLKKKKNVMDDTITESAERPRLRPKTRCLSRVWLAAKTFQTNEGLKLQCYSRTTSFAATVMGGVNLSRRLNWIGKVATGKGLDLPKDSSSGPSDAGG